MKYDLDALAEQYKDEIKEFEELKKELSDDAEEPLDPFGEAVNHEMSIIVVTGQPDFENMSLKELHKLKRKKGTVRDWVIARLAGAELMDRERERFRKMFGN